MISRSFSPRNGEVILKIYEDYRRKRENCFSPRNGEVILKVVMPSAPHVDGASFSPRNGEVILKSGIGLVSY